ncbi:MAG: HAD-IIA family hydrolase [Acidimicrobiia bacterium]
MRAVILDLDGVVYRAMSPVPGAADALRRLTESGTPVRFVTNNSTKTPEQVAAKIRQLTGVEVDPHTVLTSAMAAVSLLSPEDGPVMVVGEAGIDEAVAGVGFATTAHPDETRTVMVGLDRDFDYPRLARAAQAIRGGARFIASNSDPTYPTNSGLVPGAGAMVAAIAAAAGQEPEVAGKPHPAMRRLVRDSGVGSAWVIGDRMDTDVAMARAEEDWESILVMTGVTEAGEGTSFADHVVADLSAAVDLVLGG